jgi:hypothetical protein
MLPDGTYDIFVVDATRKGDGWLLEMTILAGGHKGDMISVGASGLTADEFDLIATPGTLTVADGEPTVRLEP